MCLHAGDLSRDQFVELVKATAWPRDSLLMTFSVAEAQFRFFGLDEDQLRASEQGRVFSPAGELKWRRVGSDLRVVYLGNEPAPAGLKDCSEKLKGLSTDKVDFMLWGERTDLETEWIEQQVPQFFSYPLSTAKHPRGRISLTVERWLAASGRVRFGRYLCLNEIPR